MTANNIVFYSHNFQRWYSKDFLGVWEILKNQMESNLFSFDKEPNERSIYIVNNFNRELLESAKKNGIPRGNRVLIAWEPRVVLPEMHDPKYFDEFGLIFTPSPFWFSSHDNAQTFKWPQSQFSGFESLNPMANRKHKFVIIQANKFSVIDGENYSLRRNLINALGPSNVSIFGSEWNSGYAHDLNRILRSLRHSPKSFHNIIRSSNFMGFNYVNYEGIAHDKYKILNEYKFSLVIENSSDYVSEKLFDSANAGCLNYYIGPDLDNFGINKSFFALGRENTNQLLDPFHVLNLDDKQIEIIAANQRRELISHMHDWLAESSMIEIARKIIINFL